MRKLIVFASVMLCAACSAFGQCGGQERWAVKDGADTTAGQVNFSNIVTQSIAQLVQIHEPKLPGDDTTRVIPDETKVVRVQARLIQWKMETDSDYHLVLDRRHGKFHASARKTNRSQHNRRNPGSQLCLRFE